MHKKLNMEEIKRNDKQKLFTIEDMAKSWSEGYHCRVDEIKEVKPIKFNTFIKNTYNIEIK